jgi:hypothetical protein
MAEAQKFSVFSVQFSGRKEELNLGARNSFRLFRKQIQRRNAQVRSKQPALLPETEL